MSIDTQPFKQHEISLERISALQARWDVALPSIVKSLYPHHFLQDADVNSQDLLTRISIEQFQLPENLTPIIGIAGPGAAGKGTLGSYLQKELDFGKIINTTTREPRALEVDGEDYFFIDNEMFSDKQRLGAFALHLERPGRGMYGVSHDEIAEKLVSHPTGCIIEENPRNLQQLLANIDNPAVTKILLYVLPKQPIIESAIGHLMHRLSLEDDPAKRVLTLELFESTLGDRQIDEFEQLATLPDHPDIVPLFVVNDDLSEAKELLKRIFT